MPAFNIIPAFPSPSFFVWSPLVRPVFLLLSIGLSSAHPVAHSLYFFLEDLSIFQWCELDDAKKHVTADKPDLFCCSLISFKQFLSKNSLVSQLYGAQLLRVLQFFLKLESHAN